MKKFFPVFLYPVADHVVTFMKHTKRGFHFSLVFSSNKVLGRFRESFLGYVIT